MKIFLYSPYSSCYEDKNVDCYDKEVKNDENDKLCTSDDQNTPKLTK